MEEGAVGWSWRGSNGAVRWSSLLSSLAAAPWAALQVLLHTVDPLWDRARRAAPVLCHHRSTVSASSMESLRCLRGRIRLLRWMQHNRCRSRKPSTTIGREIC